MRKRILLTFITAIFLVGCNEKDNCQLIPRDILFARPERYDVSMSPDGEKIAYFGKDGLYVEDLSGKLLRKFDVEPGFYAWAQTGEHLLIAQNQAGNDNSHVFCLDIKTGTSMNLTPFPNTKSEVTKISDKHPEEIAILLNMDDPNWLSAYRVNIITGKMELIFKSTEYLNFSFDNSLKPRIGFKITKDGNCGAYLLDGKKPKFLQFVALESSNKTKAFSYFAPDDNTV